MKKAVVGGANYTFKYDANGMRTEKNMSEMSSKVTYVNSGSTMVAEHNSLTGYIFNYLFDENGVRIGFDLSKESNLTQKTRYYYVFNIQGDVMGILDKTGNIIAKYNYDAWGNILSVTDGKDKVIPASQDRNIAHMNPIRYRAYYYDTETGFYYLQSRYYDPVTGRFLNADGLVQTGQGLLDQNMFAYCLNNPVMLVDPSGLCAKAHGGYYYCSNPKCSTLIAYKEKIAESKKDANATTNPSNPANTPPDHPDYKPPKNGDNKVNNPNGKGKGWKAKDGGVWVWTPTMHGDPGWTIQYPGGGHSHAYPGGGVRNHFESEQSVGKSVVNIVGGLVVIGVLLGDNFIGGYQDDHYIPGWATCIVVGFDSIMGKKYVEIVEKKDMEFDKKKLLYILEFFNYYTSELIDEVMDDSEEDPHFSAVAATNHIKCYIHMMKALGEHIYPNSVKDYILGCNYTEADYKKFKKNREKESNYYGGIQF